MSKNLTIVPFNSIGLVIADAGVKSIAALPILNFFKAQNTHFDVFFGSGGGAIIAALYAMGLSDAEIKKAFELLFAKEAIFKVSYGSIMQAVGINPFGTSIDKAALCKNDDLLKNFKEIFGSTRLEDLKYKLVVQVTQVSDGSGKVIEKGVLADILYASNALYPLVSPLEIDGELCVSGAYSSAFPTNIAKNYKLKQFFGIDFLTSEIGDSDSYFEYWLNLYHGSKVFKERDTTMAIQDIEALDKILNVEFDRGVSLWNVMDIPYILEQGEKTVLSKLSIFLKRYFQHAN